MANEKGVILALTLIFVILFCIVAAVAIVLQTNQARITESQVRRIKAFYTAEAGLAFAFEKLRQDPASLDTEWKGLQYQDGSPDDINKLGSKVTIQKIVPDPTDPSNDCRAPAGTSCLRINVPY